MEWSAGAIDIYEAAVTDGDDGLMILVVDLGLTDLCALEVIRCPRITW